MGVQPNGKSVSFPELEDVLSSVLASELSVPPAEDPPPELVLSTVLAVSSLVFEAAALDDSSLELASLEEEAVSVFVSSVSDAEVTPEDGPAVVPALDVVDGVAESAAPSDAVSPTDPVSSQPATADSHTDTATWTDHRTRPRRRGCPALAGDPSAEHEAASRRCMTPTITRPVRSRAPTAARPREVGDRDFYLRVRMTTCIQSRHPQAMTPMISQQLVHSPVAPSIDPNSMGQMKPPRPPRTPTMPPTVPTSLGK